MFKNGNIFFLANLMEVIHIELPHKGSKLTMLKIQWQDVIFEEIFVFNDETLSTLHPVYDVTIAP